MAKFKEQTDIFQFIIQHKCLHKCLQLAKESKSCLLSVRLTTSSCFFVRHLGSGHRSRGSKKDQLLFLGLCDPESSLSYTSVGWGLPLLPTALTSFSLPMYWYTTDAYYWLSLIIWFVLVTLCCPLFSSLLLLFTQMAPFPWIILPVKMPFSLPSFASCAHREDDWLLGLSGVIKCYRVFAPWGVGVYCERIELNWIELN